MGYDAILANPHRKSITRKSEIFLFWGIFSFEKKSMLRNVLEKMPHTNHSAVGKIVDLLQ